MPCPNLYDYPIRSLHYNRFGIAWGNEAGDVEQFSETTGQMEKSETEIKE